MKRLISAIKFDLLFQFRHGFYYAYLLISLLYIIIIRLLSPAFRQQVAILILYSDPVMLGFFFIGGIVLLEKGQGIFNSLFVTPFQLKEYIISKVFSLALLSTLSSYLIVLLALEKLPGLFFIYGILLSSFFYTLLGLTVGARVESINDYILLSPLIAIPFLLPLIEYLDLVNLKFLYLLPALPGLKLIAAGLGEKVPFVVLILSMLNLLIWIFLVYMWSKNWFLRYVLEGIGGEEK